MLKNYLKMSFKVLRRRKFFTFISLFGISFTLVVLMVATALLDHVFAPHPPEVRQDRTLGVYTLAMVGENGRRTGQPGYGFIQRYLKDIDGVERMTVVQHFRPVASYIEGRKIKSYLKRTDGEFWKVYDFRFIEGAPFVADDEKNANFVAVINRATKERFFAQEPAVGKSLEMDGQTFRVVGVVENIPITRFVPFADVWVPISTNKTDGYRRSDWNDFAAVYVARTKGDMKNIKLQVDERIRNSRPADSEGFREVRGGADTFFETVARMTFGNFKERTTERLMMFLAGLALLFMLLPTVNLMNVNLSRILERSSEIGVRKAFGASSRALVGQFVVENVILTLIGGALGLVMSVLVLRALNASNAIPYSDFQLNLRIFLEALLLALFFGFLSGVYPAWRMSKLHPVAALRGRSK